MGAHGHAGIAAPETVNILRYYNVSGRNLKEQVSPEALARAIQKIFTDKEYTIYLGEFSKRCITEEYDGKAGAEKLEEIYEEVTNGDFLTPISKARAIVSVPRVLACLVPVAALHRIKRKLFPQLGTSQ